MLPQLTKDADGGVTLYIQNESPGKDKEANWLPAPTGPFMMYLRLYWPKDAALDGQWTAPKVDREVFSSSRLIGLIKSTAGAFTGGVPAKAESG
jgi:hypothetical protein